MGYYVGQDGRYHEGDPRPGDVAVAQRPSEFYRWQNDAWVPDLDAMKADALRRIDDAAGQERAKYITVAPGQDMTYQEKVRQAQAFQADPAPDAEKYPLIYGEVGITAADAAGVAATVLAAFAQWQVIGAAIEQVRLAAKKAVTDATTEQDIQATFDGVTWPNPAA